MADELKQSKQPQVKDLSPSLESPYQTFFINSQPNDQAIRKSSHQIWVMAHNAFMYPNKGLNPQTVGLPGLSDSQFISKQYLDLAISLAENEM